jgi:hypothetical protein
MFRWNQPHPINIGLHGAQLAARFDKLNLLLGVVFNDTGVGLSRSMFALAVHSGVTQQLPSTGDDKFCKRLYILELLNCILPGARTDEIGIMTVLGRP